MIRLKKTFLPLTAPLWLAGCDGGGVGTPFVVLIESLAQTFYLTLLAHLFVAGGIMLILLVLIFANWKQNPKDTTDHPSDKPPS